MLPSGELDIYRVLPNWNLHSSFPLYFLFETESYDPSKPLVGKTAYGVSPGLYAMHHGSWPPTVFALSESGPKDDFHPHLAVFNRVKKAILAEMVPKKSLGTATIPLSQDEFNFLFQDLAPFASKTRQEHAGSLRFLPPKEAALETEFVNFLIGITGWTLNEAQDRLERIADGSLRSICIQYGTRAQLVYRMRKLQKGGSPASAYVKVFKEGTTEREFVHACFDLSQIKMLETKIGNFTQKTIRGEVTPRIFIDAKQNFDLDSEPDQPRFSVSYYPGELNLKIQFSFIHR